MRDLQSQHNTSLSAPSTWVGLSSLSNARLNEQIEATSSKLEALKAELANRKVSPCP